MASFGDHLVHGMSAEMEAPVWPAITAHEAELVLANFPASGSLAALLWHSPRPFSAASLLQADGGEFLLKRHDRRLRDLEGLAEEHRFIAHLDAAGMPVPELARALDGSGAVLIGEWAYELHRASRGADLYRDRLSWTPFLSNNHAHASGAALAQLHAASTGFNAPARRQRPLVASFSILPSTDPLAATEAYVASRPAVAGFLAGRPWRRELGRLFRAGNIEGLAQRLADQPALWTHNDWHPSNLLWTDGGAVRTAFDFGLADRTCAVHDLAIAIERTAVEWLRLGQGEDDLIADPDSALALLEGYAKVRPLSAGEAETVVRLLPLIHFEFALSEIDYFSGILGDEANAFVAWETYLIGHAEWFLSSPGQAFLSRIGELATI